MKGHEERILKGLSISKGIALGDAFYLASSEETIPELPIPSKEVENEIARYRKALQSSKCELEQMLLHEGSPEVVAILDSHLEMLKDPLITTEMELKIRKNQKNTEFVFHKVIADYKNRFFSIQDVFFQERVKDVADVSKRILGHLSPTKKFDLEQIPEQSILYAAEITPSLAAELDPERVLGMVTEMGGISSHAGIIARAKGIPYVAGIDIELLKNRGKNEVIVDGNQGIVILNPLPQTWEKYRKLQKKNKTLQKIWEKSATLPAETADKVEVELYGNLESLEDIDSLIKYGASGIGLFRSEYLFFTRKSLPSEDEQLEIYRKILEKLPSKPVIIRVFDIGGDKRVDFVDARGVLQETNPVLGCRAIRFLLKNRDLFTKQLRALLRAASFGNLHILLPMISDVSEIYETKKIIAGIQKELQAEGLPFKKNIPLGCMIEVPSSAIMADSIAKESDFLSVGTNDLIQYVAAADRTNPAICHLYSPAHPSILRLLKQIIQAAAECKKSLLICGEMAADPQSIPLLLGLGIRKFSVAAHHMPEVKHALRSIDTEKASEFVQEAVRFGSLEELQKFMKRRAFFPLAK